MVLQRMYLRQLVFLTNCHLFFCTFFKKLFIFFYSKIAKWWFLVKFILVLIPYKIKENDKNSTTKITTKNTTKIATDFTSELC